MISEFFENLVYVLLLFLAIAMVALPAYYTYKSDQQMKELCSRHRGAYVSNSNNTVTCLIRNQEQSNHFEYKVFARVNE